MKKRPAELLRGHFNAPLAGERLLENVNAIQEQNERRQIILSFIKGHHYLLLSVWRS
jgi:hypothetical protein